MTIIFRQFMPVVTPEIRFLIDNRTPSHNPTPALDHIGADAFSLTQQDDPLGDEL